MNKDYNEFLFGEDAPRNYGQRLVGRLSEKRADVWEFNRPAELAEVCSAADLLGWIYLKERFSEGEFVTTKMSYSMETHKTLSPLQACSIQSTGTSSSGLPLYTVEIKAGSKTSFQITYAQLPSTGTTSNKQLASSIDESLFASRSHVVVKRNQLNIYASINGPESIHWLLEYTSGQKGEFSFYGSAQEGDKYMCLPYKELVNALPYYEKMFKNKDGYVILNLTTGRLVSGLEIKENRPFTQKELYEILERKPIWEKIKIATRMAACLAFFVVPTAMHMQKTSEMEALIKKENKTDQDKADIESYIAFLEGLSAPM